MLAYDLDDKPNIDFDFRKLSITSRIELTRLVIEHGSPDPIGGRSDAQSLRIQSGGQ